MSNETPKTVNITPSRGALTEILNRLVDSMQRKHGLSIQERDGGDLGLIVNVRNQDGAHFYQAQTGDELAALLVGYNQGARRYAPDLDEGDEVIVTGAFRGDNPYKDDEEGANYQDEPDMIEVPVGTRGVVSQAISQGEVQVRFETDELDNGRPHYWLVDRAQIALVKNLD